MEFHGAWTIHPKFGRQFKAEKAVEKKPATTAALEKYIGSGLIKGVGPKTAKKIVNHFRETTLEIFEGDIERVRLFCDDHGQHLKAVHSYFQFLNLIT